MSGSAGSGLVASIGEDGRPPAAVAAAPSRERVVARRVALAATILLAFVLGAPHLTDEGYVSLQGDMPRYLMNGVYFLDLLRDRPFGSFDMFMEYTQLYYSRYPALSLGHHPPLLSVATVPLFSAMGISVVAGRIVMLVAFVSLVAYVYLLAQDAYGGAAGAIAAIFVATSPLTIGLGQAVLSEVPAVALIVAAAYYLQRYCTTRRRRTLAAFVAAAALSVYAKQLAIFAFPGFPLLLWTTIGWRSLFRRDIVVAAAVLVALVVPMAIVSVVLSPSNVTIAAGSAARGLDNVGSLAKNALAPQLAKPVWGLAIAGAVVAVARRDWRAFTYVVWVAGAFIGMLLVGRHDPPRFTIYGVPAIAILAASVSAGWRAFPTRLAAGAILVAVAVAQVPAAAATRLPGAAGYEEAARAVLAAPDPGPTVLFTGDIDTGFFSFFVRKHDPARRLVVLRADKLLTTSFLARPDLDNRISDPTEIYVLLQRFGTRFVVLEDRPSRAPVLEWLRQELKSDRFAERRRMPLVSTDFRVRGMELVVYEYLRATPPSPEAILSMHLPLAHRSLEVKLADLIDRKFLR